MEMKPRGKHLTRNAGLPSGRYDYRNEDDVEKQRLDQIAKREEAIRKAEAENKETFNPTEGERPKTSIEDISIKIESLRNSLAKELGSDALAEIAYNSMNTAEIVSFPTMDDPEARKALIASLVERAKGIQAEAEKKVDPRILQMKEAYVMNQINQFVGGDAKLAQRAIAEIPTEHLNAYLASTSSKADMKAFAEMLAERVLPEIPDANIEQIPDTKPVITPEAAESIAAAAEEEATPEQKPPVNEPNPMTLQ